jgi:amino acid permease
MVGAGVLGLPATFTHLGWAGGIIILIFSLGVSWSVDGTMCIAPF